MHGTTGKQLGRKDRKLKNNFGNDFFWVNDHHRTQFMKAFPLMGPAITNPNLLANGIPGLQGELQRIQLTAPWTYTALMKAGLLT